MRKFNTNILAAVLLQYAAGMTLHELGIDDAEFNQECDYANDPECDMFGTSSAELDNFEDWEADLSLG